MPQSQASLHSSPTPRQYGDVAAVYDALMDVVPHTAWLNRIERAVRERGKSPQSVLEVACGTGIVTEMLYQHGYRPVYGIDISGAMVQIAKTKAEAKGLPIAYQEQDAAKLDLNGTRFDLVVSLFDSLNYITEPEHLRQAFLRVYQHLNSGGIFAFDLNSVYALTTEMFTQTNLEGPIRHVWNSYWDADTRLCRVEMAFEVIDAETGERRQFTETHVQRGYTQTEIKSYLSEAGFVNVQVFGNYGDRTPNAKSDRWLFITEKS